MLFGPDARGLFINTPGHSELCIQPCLVRERMRRQLQMQPSRSQTLRLQLLQLPPRPTLQLQHQVSLQYCSCNQHLKALILHSCVTRVRCHDATASLVNAQDSSVSSADVCMTVSSEIVVHAAALQGDQGTASAEVFPASDANESCHLRLHINISYSDRQLKGSVCPYMSKSCLPCESKLSCKHIPCIFRQALILAVS